MKFAGYNDPFTAIADYYDALMSFVNYPAWVSYIESILKLNEIRQREILDLACGTGVCLEIWRQKGYKIWGLDRSRAMLDVCRRRFDRLGIDDVRLINADMRYRVLKGAFPILTCLYDSLNYNLNIEDLFSCAKNAHACLKPDGIFIFDMNTIHCLRDEWGSNRYERDDNNIHSVWRNSFDAETNVSSLRITLRIRHNGRNLVLREHHEERGYSLREIGECLQAAGFRINLYRHLTFNPAQENDIRIMGVARKC